MDPTKRARARRLLQEIDNHTIEIAELNQKSGPLSQLEHSRRESLCARRDRAAEKLQTIWNDDVPRRDAIICGLRRALHIGFGFYCTMGTSNPTFPVQGWKQNPSSSA